MAAPIDHNPKVLNFFISEVHKESDFRSFSPKRSEPSLRHRAASIMSSDRIPNALTFLALESQKIISSGEINRLSFEELNTFSTNLETLICEINKIERISSELAPSLKSTRQTITNRQNQSNDLAIRGMTIYQKMITEAKEQNQNTRGSVSFEGPWKPSPPDHELMLGVMTILTKRPVSSMEIANFLDQNFPNQNFSSIIACFLPFITDIDLLREICGKDANLKEIKQELLDLLGKLAMRRGQDIYPEWIFFRSAIPKLMRNV